MAKNRQQDRAQRARGVAVLAQEQRRQDFRQLIQVGRESFHGCLQVPVFLRAFQCLGARAPAPGHARLSTVFHTR